MYLKISEHIGQLQEVIVSLNTLYSPKRTITLTEAKVKVVLKSVSNSFPIRRVLSMCDLGLRFFRYISLLQDKHREQFNKVVAGLIYILPRQSITSTGIKVQCLLESLLSLLTLNYSTLYAFDLRFLVPIPVYYYKTTKPCYHLKLHTRYRSSICLDKAAKVGQ